MAINDPSEFDDALEHERRMFEEDDIECCTECGEETSNESGVCDDCEEELNGLGDNSEEEDDDA